MNLIAQRTYDQVYNALRSRISQRGFSFNVRAFADGSAFVEVQFTAGNKQGSVSAIITPEFYDQDPTAIRTWIIADSSERFEAASLGVAISRLSYLIQKAYTLLYKLRSN